MTARGKQIQAHGRKDGAYQNTAWEGIRFEYYRFYLFAQLQALDIGNGGGKVFEMRRCRMWVESLVFCLCVVVDSDFEGKLYG